MDLDRDWNTGYVMNLIEASNRGGSFGNRAERNRRAGNRRPAYRRGYRQASTQNAHPSEWRGGRAENETGRRPGGRAQRERREPDDGGERPGELAERDREISGPQSPAWLPAPARR